MSLDNPSHCAWLPSQCKNLFLTYLSGISCVSACAHCLLLCHWAQERRAQLYPLFCSHQVSVHTDEIPLSLFSRLNSCSSQPLIIYQIFLSLNHLHGPFSRRLYPVCSDLIIGSQVLPRRALHTWPHLCWVEGQDDHPPADNTIANAVQEPIGLCHKHILLVCIQLGFQQDLEDLFCKAAFQPVDILPVKGHEVFPSPCHFPSLNILTFSSAHFSSLSRSLWIPQLAIQNLKSSSYSGKVQEALKLEFIQNLWLKCLELSASMLLWHTSKQYKHACHYKVNW